jgi:hypothetical protein
MDQADTSPRPVVDWLTVAAIAAIAISLTVAFHEGIHAVMCLLVGGNLQEYSALHVACVAPGPWQSRLIDGSASIANILLGMCLWLILRRTLHRPPAAIYFIWLWMAMNWFSGAGYWLFSGVANVGDWAAVIEGWEPHWVYRLSMILLGAVTFMAFVWLALQEFGKFVGGSAPEQIRRASKLGIVSYVAAVLVAVLAAVFNPYGLSGLPATAGVFAVLGAQSPLLWMMQWFRSPGFQKAQVPPLEIGRNWGLVFGALAVVFLYGVILGRTLYF